MRPSHQRPSRKLTSSPGHQAPPISSWHLARSRSRSTSRLSRRRPRAARPGRRGPWGALVLLLALWLTGGPAEADVRPGSGVWPLSPRPPVTARFTPPATRWGSGHRGVDLAGHLAQPVRAALAGRVAFAGRIAGRGVVVVDHGGTRTTYEPVAATVHVGDRVGYGAMIGRLELFGSHCFPRWCLHWGLIEGRDHYLDPLTIVGATPVILLPVASAANVTVLGLPAPGPGWALPAWRVPPGASRAAGVGTGGARSGPGIGSDVCHE